MKNIFFGFVIGATTLAACNDSNNKVAENAANQQQIESERLKAQAAEVRRFHVPDATVGILN